MVELLIQHGADVNARFAGPHTETPLHWAASSDDVEVLDALLDARADIEALCGIRSRLSPLRPRATVPSCPKTRDPIGECRHRGTVKTVTVDLDTLPAELARSVRAARRRRGNVETKAFVSRGLDPVIGDWAKSLIASGELDAAIAEIAASDPDLHS